MVIHNLNFNRREIPENVIAEPFFLSNGDDIKVWRYMELWKFKKLLKEESLYLANHSTFEDPFEGVFPKNYDLTRDELKRKYKLPDNVEESFYKLQRQYRNYTYINCWHMSNYESAAMWKIYNKSNQSIAIQSTYRKLIDEVSKHNDLYVSGVGYIDYETDRIPIGNMQYNFLFKRNSFDFEKELRIINLDFEAQRNSRLIKKGKLYTIDIRSLIENIYISPFSNKEFEDDLSLLINNSRVDLPIIKSRLYDDPIK